MLHAPHKLDGQALCGAPVDAENEVLSSSGIPARITFPPGITAANDILDRFLLPGRFERDIHASSSGRRLDLPHALSLSSVKKAWSAPKLLPRPRDGGVYLSQ